jgi:hypothetical protein
VRADGPLDDQDLALLVELRELYERVDPVPSGLVEQAQFALTLESFDIEVLRPRSAGQLALATRGEEQSRTITFDTETLTIMISISATGLDQVRIDGWLAPPAPHPIELRHFGGSLTTVADNQGRFVLDLVPHGTAQIVVRPGPSGHVVATPSIVV